MNAAFIIRTWKNLVFCIYIFFILIYIYQKYVSRFSGKEKQLFWNLKFHAVLSTIFSQLNLTLNCYSAMVSSWRHVISPVTEWKTQSNPAMTQHIRERSRNPPHPNAWNGAGTLASPPPMPKHKTVVYFPFPHQWCIIVSERPSSKNCVTQGPVHRFATLINSLVPAWYKPPPKVIREHTFVWK